MHGIRFRVFVYIIPKNQPEIICPESIMQPNIKAVAISKPSNIGIMKSLNMWAKPNIIPVHFQDLTWPIALSNFDWMMPRQKNSSRIEFWYITINKNNNGAGSGTPPDIKSIISNTITINNANTNTFGCWISVVKPRSLASHLWAE